MMTRTMRHALVLMIGVAVGLMSAAAFAQQRHGPPGGPPPESADEQPDPGMPGDRDFDEFTMQPGPGMPPGDEGPRHKGKPGPGMHQRPDGPPPGGDFRPGGGPMQGGLAGGLGGGMPPPGMMAGHGPMGFNIEKRDPEMFKLIQEDMALEQQARELAMQYRNASGEDREKIKKQVVETVTKQFEVRQQRRTLELKRLEDELKRLRELVERRAKARKELVEKRVSDLVGPDQPEVEF